MARCRCSSEGASGAAASGGDCIEITGAGTPASPFVVDLVLDPDAGNLLTCGAAGLMGTAPAEQVTLNEVQGSWTPGAPAASAGGWLRKIGHKTGTTDGFGSITVTFTDPFPNGIAKVFANIGSFYTVGAYVVVVDAPEPTVNGFIVQAWHGVSGVPLVSTAIHFDWEAEGW